MKRKHERMVVWMGMAIFLALSTLTRSPQVEAQSVLTLDLIKYGLRDRVQASGYITSKPIPCLGNIVGGRDQMVNFSEGEVVYIELLAERQVKAGDRFPVIRLGKFVTDPQTGKKFGNLLLIAGELVILEEGRKKVVSARIEKSYRSINIGDQIIPPEKAIPAAIPLRTAKKIEGAVIATQETVENISQNEIIFINRGSQDGVIVGNLFSIYKLGYFAEDALTGKNVRLPLIKAGEAVVVSVQEETSAAIVTLSSQGFSIGDKVISDAE